MKYILPLLLFTVSLFATADGPDCWRVTGLNEAVSLNVREQPTHESALIGTIPHNATGLKNLETEGGLTFEEFTSLSQEERDSIAEVRPRWQKISYNGITGWVLGEYLAEGSCRTIVKELSE